MAAAYPLLGLKTVRDRRLNTSVKERILRQQQHEQACHAAVAKRKELEDYRIYMVEESSRRYQELFKSTHSLKEIEQFNASIKRLYAGEFELEEEVKKAEHAAAKAQEEFNKARAAETECRKKLQKLETHQQIWETEQKLYEERAADMELEDFIPRDKAFR